VYRQGRTIVFILFDESEGSGTMPFYAVAPGVRPGLRIATELDHAECSGLAPDPGRRLVSCAVA